MSDQQDELGPKDRIDAWRTACRGTVLAVKQQWTHLSRRKQNYVRALLFSLGLVLIVFGTATAVDASLATSQIEDGETVWQGEVVTWSDGLDASDAVTVTATDHYFYREYLADENGTVSFPTTDFAPGEYQIERGSTTVATFHVRKQTVTSTAIDPDRQNGTVSFTFDSPRARYPLHVDSDTLSDDDLAEIFVDEQLRREDLDEDESAEVVLEGVTRDTVLTGDFDDYRGDHELLFTVPDTTGAVRVDVGLRPAEYDRPRVLEAQPEELGDVAQVTIATADEYRVPVRIGGPSVHYALNFSVVDANNDDRVHVRLDTSTMGLAERSVSVRSPDRVEAVSETSLGTTVEPVDYPVRLGDHEDADEAVLSLREGGATNVTVRHYPSDAEVASLERVREGEPGTTVEVGEQFAVAWNISGVYADLGAPSAADLEGGVNNLSVTMIEAEPDMNTDRETVSVASGRLLVEPAADTLALVVDTNETTVETDKTYNVHLNVSTPGYQNLTTPVHVVETREPAEPTTTRTTTSTTTTTQPSTTAPAETTRTTRTSTPTTTLPETPTTTTSTETTAVSTLSRASTANAGNAPGATESSSGGIPWKTLVVCIALLGIGVLWLQPNNIQRRR